MKCFPSSRAARLRLLALVVVLAVISYVFHVQSALYLLSYHPREGDILFQSLPHDPLVDAIEGVTHSPYSHCGVVIKSGDHWVVIESIFDVHETPLLRWLTRGRSGGFAAYRLDSRFEKAIPNFKKELLAYTGYPYDFDYSLSDQAIYCSELPYKAFKKATGEELGKIEALGDLDWKPYNGFIKSVQGKVPLEREMITPVSLAKAHQLKEVFRKGIDGPALNP
ncbi:MAG: YiiX/YebB-like N1pC/P60 family cysteine hydrolase [Chthoniobacteraceae bacterium]